MLDGEDIITIYIDVYLFLAPRYSALRRTMSSAFWADIPGGGFLLVGLPNELLLHTQSFRDRGP